VPRFDRASPRQISWKAAAALPGVAMAVPHGGILRPFGRTAWLAGQRRQVALRLRGDSRDGDRASPGCQGAFIQKAASGVARGTRRRATVPTGVLPRRVTSWAAGEARTNTWGDGVDWFRDVCKGLFGACECAPSRCGRVCTPCLRLCTHRSRLFGSRWLMSAVPPKAAK